MVLVLVLKQILGTSCRVFWIRHLHVQRGPVAAAAKVCIILLIARSHRRHRQTVLSCPHQRCDDNCRQDKTVLFCLHPVSMSFVLSIDPDFNCQSSMYLRLNSCKLETGSRQNKTSCLVCSCVHTAETDKTRQFCLVHVDHVNKL